MYQTQISRTQQELTARSAFWLTCPDCGHTGRTLAVMASRVLRQRRGCPQCRSTSEPHLRQTSSGAHIPVSEGQHTASTDAEAAYLRAWIESDDRQSRLHHSLRALRSRLTARFSRKRSAAVRTQSHTGPSGYDLTHLEE